MGDVVNAFSKHPYDTGWIPEGIVRTGMCRAGLWYVFYHAPQRVTIELANGNEFDKLTVPIPGTLMIAAGMGYWFYAVKDRKISDSTVLYNVPLPNSGYDGTVCFGSNAKYEVKLETAAKMWQLFLSSPFTASGAANLTNDKAYTGDIRPFLRKLSEENADEYPLGTLTKMRSGAETVGAKVEWILGRETSD